MPLSCQAASRRPKPAASVEASLREPESLDIESMPQLVLDPAVKSTIGNLAGRMMVCLFMDNKPLVDAMNGAGKLDREDMRPLLVRTARSWHQMLRWVSNRTQPSVRFHGPSPLMWLPRKFNVQADYLCHYTLALRSSWSKTFDRLQNWQPREGDCIAGWSDGGFDASQGGTAGYVIAVHREGVWQSLKAGGVYDSTIAGNDSLRMEAIGMELMMQDMLRLLESV